MSDGKGHLQGHRRRVDRIERGARREVLCRFVGPDGHVHARLGLGCYEERVVDVLVENTDADFEQVRATAKSYGFDRIEPLIDEAVAERARRR